MSIPAKLLFSCSTPALRAVLIGIMSQCVICSALALTVSTNAANSNHPLWNTNWENLIKRVNQTNSVFSENGEQDRAETNILRFIKEGETQFGKDSIEASIALNAAAWFYLEDQPNYRQAESFFRRAFDILQHNLQTDNVLTANSFNGLAHCYGLLGDLNEAEKDYLEAIAICDRISEGTNVQVTYALNGLGDLYLREGSYNRAENIFERGLKIRQQQPGGMESIETAGSMGNLAAVYMLTGRTNEAENLFTSALAIYTRPDLTNNVGRAYLLRISSWLYLMSTNYDRAEPRLCEALRIYGAATGPKSPWTITCCQRLSLLKAFCGRRDEAIRLAKRTLEARDGILADVFSFTSEQERLSWKQQSDPFSLPCTLGEADLIAQAVLRHKGIVLESLIEDQQVAKARLDAESEQIRSQLESVQREVVKAFNSKSGNPQKALDKLKNLRRDLARKLPGTGATRRALNVNLADVQKALPTNTVLVEYVLYNHYLSVCQYNRCYGALVIKKSAQPIWVPLGSAKQLDEKIQYYQRLMTNWVREDQLAKLLDELYAGIWGKLETNIASDDRVLISPDGQLNFLSFATLLTPSGHFLVEKHLLGYVASGRDLVFANKVTTNRHLSLWAAPAFDLEPEAVQQKISEGSEQSRGVLNSLDRGADFPHSDYLTWAQKEGEYLAKDAAGLGFESVDYHCGTNATKASLRQVRHPYALHIASHAFVMADGTVQTAPGNETNAFYAEWAPRSTEVDPMYRSGVVLAGANITREKWMKGDAVPPENDGFLLASEVEELDLQGTWLVVLSACNTASGAVNAGEGVLGLRRAFVQAGAQRLLLTLWSIQDKHTVEWMRKFYTSAMKEKEPLWACAEVQRDELVSLKPDLLNAVQEAGPYILSTTTVK
jgi:CHAT domain-containing protein